ncbi:hypothetical protein I4U23_012962 [Adineta vaga]|nr:hypothetical protein I4U23_012962 [Adineta vaga]
MSVPYQQDANNHIYNLLFCDQLDLYKRSNSSSEDPWYLVLSDAPDSEKLTKLSQHTNVESRLRLLAYHRLQQMNQSVSKKELLGVIIEIRFAHGQDTLAAYQDGSVRYINQAEKVIIWENRTEESDKLIHNLFQASQNVVDCIGPWLEKRNPPPTVGRCRLSFLVSGQLYFGEGLLEQFSADSMAGPVISSAFQLLQYLMAATSINTISNQNV